MQSLRFFVRPIQISSGKLTDRNITVEMIVDICSSIFQSTKVCVRDFDRGCAGLLPIVPGSETSFQLLSLHRTVWCNSFLCNLQSGCTCIISRGNGQLRTDTDTSAMGLYIHCEIFLSNSGHSKAGVISISTERTGIFLCISVFAAPFPEMKLLRNRQLRAIRRILLQSMDS